MIFQKQESLIHGLFDLALDLNLLIAFAIDSFISRSSSVISFSFFPGGICSLGDGEGRGCPLEKSVRPVGVSPVAPSAVSSMCELDSGTAE